MSGDARIALDAAIIVAASARLAVLVSRDEITRRLREVVYRTSAPLHAKDVNGSPWRLLHPYRTTRRERDMGMRRWEYELEPSSARDPGWIGCLVECPSCTSFWTLHAALLAYVVLGGVVPTLLTPIALWGVASWLAVRL